MAFRKTVKCSDKVSAFFGGFHERKTIPVSDGSGLSKHELCDVGVSELAETTLPLVSLSEVQASGQYIQGNVDFSPNDPVKFNEVEITLQNYVDNYQSNVKPSNKEENE